MAFDTKYYYTNVKVWSRRYGIEISEERAGKALRLLEAQGVSETIAPMVAVLFCVLKDVHGLTGEDAFKHALICGRALTEEVRGNSHSTPTDTYVSWVTCKAPGWERTVDFARRNAWTIDAVVRTGITARADEYTRPNLMREIKKSLKEGVLV